METVDRKISNFELIAKEEAIRIRDSLLAEVEDKINTAMKGATEDFKREARELHLKEIEEAYKEAGYIISTSQNGASNKLLQKRNEIVNNIFIELESKLIEFTSKEEYKDYFLKKLRETLLKAKSVIGQRDYDISILITKQDYQKLRGQIEATYMQYFQKDKVVVLEHTEKIIGGCIISIEKLKLKIDNTVKTFVEMEREAFLQDNELSLK